MATTTDPRNVATPSDDPTEKCREFWAAPKDACGLTLAGEDLAEARALADQLRSAAGDPLPEPYPTQAEFDRKAAARAALTGVIAAHGDGSELPESNKAAKWAVEYADALAARLKNPA